MWQQLTQQTFTPRQVVCATNQPIFNMMPAGGTEKTAQRTVLAFAAEIVGDFCKKKTLTLCLSK